MGKDVFEGLEFTNKYSEVYKKILLAKPSRIQGLKKHLSKGGEMETFLPFLIGDGYSEFWESKKRYRVVKGSRSSKKTITTARNFIYNLMKYPESNLLVVRKVGAINRDSTYAELKKAIKDLKVETLWKETVNPLELTYLPTNQKILFRGLDDAQKISGITVAVGELCWCWVNDSPLVEKLSKKMH